MATAIQNAFIERIKEKDWLDNTTKEKCIDKVIKLLKAE